MEDVRSTYGKDENNASTTPSEDIVWAEGLVPGIDFCNHGTLKIFFYICNFIWIFCTISYNVVG